MEYTEEEENKDNIRNELAKNDFYPDLYIFQDDDSVFIIVLPNGRNIISYAPVKCVYAYGHILNTIEYLEEKND